MPGQVRGKTTLASSGGSFRPGENTSPDGTLPASALRVEKTAARFDEAKTAAGAARDVYKAAAIDAFSARMAKHPDVTEVVLEMGEDNLEIKSFLDKDGRVLVIRDPALSECLGHFTSYVDARSGGYGFSYNETDSSFTYSGFAALDADRLATANRAYYDAGHVAFDAESVAQDAGVAALEARVLHQHPTAESITATQYDFENGDFDAGPLRVVGVLDKTGKRLGRGDAQMSDCLSLFTDFDDIRKNRHGFEYDEDSMDFNLPLTLDNY